MGNPRAPAQVRPRASSRANYHERAVQGVVMSTLPWSPVPSPYIHHASIMFARSLVRPALSAVKAQPQQQAGMATLREIEMR